MLRAKKQFHVFGELVEILVTSAESKGSFCVLKQFSPPGGGPPPHVHSREDEFFTVLAGEYEIFDGTTWHPLGTSESTFTLRGNPHTFRNRGSSVGCMQTTVVPGGLDLYLEELSRLSMPPVMEEVVKLSTPYGIRFLPPPTA